MIFVLCSREKAPKNKTNKHIENTAKAFLLKNKKMILLNKAEISFCNENVLGKN